MRRRIKLNHLQAEPGQRRRTQRRIWMERRQTCHAAPAILHLAPAERIGGTGAEVDYDPDARNTDDSGGGAESNAETCCYDPDNGIGAHAAKVGHSAVRVPDETMERTSKMLGGRANGESECETMEQTSTMLGDGQMVRLSLKA